MKKVLWALCVLGVLCCVLCVSAFAQSPLDRSLQIRKAQTPSDGEVHVVPVQGNVYMLVGGGGNIAVQIGDEGVLVVDTGTTPMSEKVLAAIKKLSPNRFATSSTPISIRIIRAEMRSSPRPAARRAAVRPTSSRTKTCWHG